MDESLYKSLSLLFSIDQDSAFRHCESILCGSNFRSFPDFINYYRKKLKCHTCQASWDDGCLAGHCLDCQKVDNSCICIKCFIEGGHSNHRAYLTKSGMGNCDCGDISFWKKEGFCPSHSGYDENSESSELPPELREKMIAVFCAALKNFIFLGNHDFEHFEDLIDWLNVFIPIGDAFRRCVCIAFNRIFRQSGFIMAISTFKKESMDLMINFFGSLINDSEFSLHFGYRSLVEYPTLVWMMLKTVADQTTNDIEVLQTFQEFCFHSFAPQTIEFLVQQSEDKDEEEEQEGDEKQESGQANETKNEIENNADKSHEIALQSNDITATKLYNSSKETNQSKTNIEETDIEETNIEETNIEETDIEETNIEETNIEETDIEETNIEETITEEINTEKYNHRSNSDRLTERKSIMNSQLNSRKMETKSTLNTKFHTEKKKNSFHQSKNESKKKKLCYLNEPCDWVSIFEEILVLLLNFYSRDPSFAFFSKTKMDNHFSHLQSLLLLASKITHQEKNLQRCCKIFAHQLQMLEGSMPFSIETKGLSDNPHMHHKTNNIVTYHLAKLSKQFMEIGNCYDSSILIALNHTFIKENYDLPKTCSNSNFFYQAHTNLNQTHINKTSNNKMNNNQLNNQKTDVLKIYQRSPFDPCVRCSTSLSLHSLVARMLVTQKNKIQRIFKNTCKALKIANPDDFCLCWATLPLRLLSIINLEYNGLLSKNAKDLRIEIRSFIFTSSIEIRVLPIFTGIQMAFGLIKDKEVFIDSIARILGVYPQQNDKSIARNFEFYFLLLVGGIAFERSCITNNLAEFRKLQIMTCLKNKEMTLSDIAKNLGLEIANDPVFGEDLKSYTSKVQYNSQNYYKLSNDSHWHPFLPFIPMTTVMPIVSEYINYNKDSLLPFPFDEIMNEPDPYNLSIKSILLTKVLFAIEFQVILQVKENNDGSLEESLRLVFILLIAASMISPKSLIFESLQNTQNDQQNTNSQENIKIQTVKANDVVELATFLPSNFFEFLITPIILKNNGETTMIKLIENCGIIGINALERMNINYKPTKIANNKANHAKERAYQMKMEIMNNFSMRNKSFCTTAGYQFPVSEECCICRSEESEEFGYPSLTYNTCIPMHVLKSKEWRKTLGIRVCPHLVHIKCIEKPNDFNCAIDRTHRNCIIPKISSNYEIRKFEKAESLNNFLKLGFQNSYQKAVLTFASELMILEVRHRMRPECLDRDSYPIMFSNFFKVLWYLFNDKQTLPKSSDPFVMLVNRLIASEQPSDEFYTIASDIASKINHENQIDENLISKPINDNDDDNFSENWKEQYLNQYQFLRRAALFMRFVFSPSESQFIEWDEVLSSESVFQEFKFQPNLTSPSKIDEKCPELDLFRFFHLPESYLSLLMPPYSFNILDTKHEIAVCLLTGRVVSFNENNSNSKDCYVLDHLKKFCNSATSAFLMMTGDRTTAILIVSFEFKIAIQMNGIYTDYCGDQDIGLKMGKILNLSEDRLEKIEECVLSGDWTDLINSQNATQIFP